jgi:hypothetical protein
MDDFFRRLALAGCTGDLLVPLVFLGGQTPLLNWQISNLAGWFTGMHLQTATAFLSMLLPMLSSSLCSASSCAACWQVW